jgi:hypothetical protein
VFIYRQQKRRGYTMLACVVLMSKKIDNRSALVDGTAMSSISSNKPLS